MTKIVVFLLAGIAAMPAAAQCSLRPTCDSSVYEIRSQLTVVVPLPGNSHLDAAVKAVQAAQDQLTALSAKEFDAVKAVYGSDASLRQASINSNMQDIGPRGMSASVFLNSTYDVKKPIK